MVIFTEKYKVLAFDLDDTLVDDVQAMKYAISKVYEYLHIVPQEELLSQYVQFDADFWEAYQEGKIVVPEKLPTDWTTYLRSIRFVEFFKDIPIRFQEGVVLNTIYSSNLGGCIVPIEGVRETLEILQNYYKLVIITNGVKKLIAKKLETAKIASLFSGIVCSEDVGINKPHPLFYEQLFNICDCDRSEVLAIGDSLSSDILGGMQNGMDTAWFNHRNKPLLSGYTPTYEFHHFPELTKKLVV